MFSVRVENMESGIQKRIRKRKRNRNDFIHILFHFFYYRVHAENRFLKKLTKFTTSWRGKYFSAADQVRHQMFIYTRRCKIFILWKHRTLPRICICFKSLEFSLYFTNKKKLNYRWKWNRDRDNFYKELQAILKFHELTGWNFDLLQSFISV